MAEDAFRKQTMQLDKMHWGFRLTFAFLWLLLAINAAIFPMISRSVETSLALATLQFILLFILILYYAYLYVRYVRS